MDRPVLMTLVCSGCGVLTQINPFDDNSKKYFDDPQAISMIDAASKGRIDFMPSRRSGYSPGVSRPIRRESCRLAVSGAPPNGGTAR
ncbi:hypothetical protein ABH922_004560 [Rhodococcus sp. 27YEA15]|uniref:hypothetical protein n=1 Tax=Rhodococcus sp. 27YEA15 TaxID=3156259 RepID=UPI003C7E7B52